MSQAIQERWDRRLQNWSLWMAGSSASTSSPYPAYRYHVPERAWWDQSSRPPQPLVGEALDVDGLLTVIQGEGARGLELFMAVRAFYCWSGSLADSAKSLRIHVDTLTDRVVAARYRLEDLWQALHVAASVRRGNILALAA